MMQSYNEQRLSKAKKLVMLVPLVAVAAFGLAQTSTTSTHRSLKAETHRSLATAVASAVDFCPVLQSDTDFFGNDIGSISGSGAADCCIKCSHRSGCGAFTWSSHNGGTCWLKTTKPANVGYNFGVVSAILSVCPGMQEANVDYQGNDIGNVPGSGAGDCCSKCSQRSGCGAYTWSNYNGGTCWLKSSKGATASKTGVVSGYLGVTTTPLPTTPAPVPASCLTVEVGVDYTGNDVANVPGTGADDCCTKCSQRSGCGAFTWSNHNGGTCWLKSGKGASTTMTGVVSGTVATTAPPATPVPASCASIDVDTDYVGNDVANVAGTGADDCCTKCSQRAGCGAYTWVSYNGGTCWLKSGKSATKSSPGAVSGIPKTKAPSAPPATTPVPAGTTVTNPFVTSCPTYLKDVDYVGNDIGSVAGAAATDCCAKCMQRSGCGAFTWSDFNGGTCWLKSVRGTAVDKAGVVSALVVVSLPAPSPAPAAPAGYPTGHIYGGATKAITELISADGAVGNPPSYTTSCALPNYTSRYNKIFVTGPNGDSQPMAIKGINWFGMETSATLPLGMWYSPEQGSTAYSIAALLARNNFNSVRLPICMDSLLRNIVPDHTVVNATANRAIKTDNYINALKSIIKALGFRQITVLIDIHTLTTKDIGSLWYSDKISEAQYMQGIDILTQNLCSNEFFNVMGVDLKNEPYDATWGDNSAKDFRAASVRMGNRMLAGCPKWLAFVEGTADAYAFTNSVGKTNYAGWWGGGLMKAKQSPVVLNIPNKVVYVPHFYTSAVWPTGYYYGDNYAEQPDALLKENTKAAFDGMFGYLAQDGSSPAVVLGEFGGLFSLDRHPQKTIQRAFLYTVELLMRQGFAGGYVWTLNPESGYDWNPTNKQGMFQEGLLLSDWRTVNEPFLAALKPMDNMADLNFLQCY